MSAVQATREHLIHQYGTLTGKRLARPPRCLHDRRDRREAEPTLAELRLQVAGLWAAHYLCFFGMHVLTPTVFHSARRAVRGDVSRSRPDPLTNGPNVLARRGGKYLAARRRDEAQPGREVRYGSRPIALALAGVDRDRILALLLESIVKMNEAPQEEGLAAKMSGVGESTDRDVLAVSRFSSSSLAVLFPMSEWMTARGTLLIETITSRDPAVRDRSVLELIAGVPVDEVLDACDALEQFRQGAENLYELSRRDYNVPARD